MARELDAPSLQPRPDATPAADALLALVQPPALAHAESSQGHVTWTVQSELPRLLDALVAPASAGLAPATLAELDAPKPKAVPPAARAQNVVK